MVVNGFTGFEVFDGKLYLNPQLPKEWRLVEYQVELNDIVYKMMIHEDYFDIILEHVTKDPIALMLNDQEFPLGEGQNRFTKGQDY